MDSFRIIYDRLLTIEYNPFGANKQKIKRIDHRKRNARADKCNLLTEIPFEQAVVF